LFRSVHLGVSSRGNVLNGHLHRGNLLLVESLFLESVDDLFEGEAFVTPLGFSLFFSSFFLGFEVSLGKLPDFFFILSLSLGGFLGSFLFLLLIPGHTVLGFELGDLFRFFGLLSHLFESKLGLSPFLFLCIKHSFVGGDSSFSGAGFNLTTSETDEESPILGSVEVITSYGQEVFNG